MSLRRKLLSNLSWIFGAKHWIFISSLHVPEQNARSHSMFLRIRQHQTHDLHCVRISAYTIDITTHKTKVHGLAAVCHTFTISVSCINVGVPLCCVHRSKYPATCTKQSGRSVTDAVINYSNLKSHGILNTVIFWVAFFLVFI